MESHDIIFFPNLENSSLLQLRWRALIQMLHLSRCSWGTVKLRELIQVLVYAYSCRIEHVFLMAKIQVDFSHLATSCFEVINSSLSRNMPSFSPIVFRKHYCLLKIILPCRWILDVEASYMTVILFFFSMPLYWMGLTVLFIRYILRHHKGESNINIYTDINSTNN